PAACLRCISSRCDSGCVAGEGRDSTAAPDTVPSARSIPESARSNLLKRRMSMRVSGKERPILLYESLGGARLRATTELLAMDGVGHGWGPWSRRHAPTWVAPIVAQARSMD